MTVETTTTIPGPYPTNGVATAFPFSFRALSADEVQVVREVGGVEATVSPSLYKVQLSAQSGTVVFDAPPAAGSNIYVLSDPDFKQNISFSNQSAFLPSSHNEANDRSAIRAQVLAEQVKRAPVLPLDPSKAAGLFPKVLADGSWGYEAAGPGATGPANSTYTSLASLKAAPVTNGSYILLTKSGPITYAYVEGDFSATPAEQLDVDVVKLNAVALTTGALIRKRDVVSVTDYRFATDVDDTAAFERASRAAKKILVPAGQGRGSDGRYIVNDATIVSNTVIVGDGMGSTVISPPAGVVSGAGPASRATFKTELTFNIGLYDFTADGGVERDGFSEHCHLVACYGVRGFTAERVEFRGFRGDGLIFEGQPRNFSGSASEARHNVDLSVHNCAFDGVNNNNRNGISVVDGTNVSITNNTFRRVTKSGNVNVALDPMNPNTGIPMPGAIDFEPNPYSFYVIQNVTVSGNTIDSCGGNFAHIGFFIPTEVTFVPADIKITGNDIRNSVQSGTGADILIHLNRDLGTTTTSQGIMISGNTGFKGRSPYFIRSARGVVIDETNRWEQYDFAASIGYLTNADKTYDITTAATLVRVGMSAPSQFGQAVFNVIRHKDRTRFIDCGDGSANAAATALLTGASSDVTRDGVVVASPGGFTKRAVFADGHSQTPATNRTGVVDDGGLPSVFSATAPGQVIRAEFAWTPGVVLRVSSQLATFGVPGAALGDLVVWSYSQELDLTHFMICRVREPNTVLVGIYTTADAQITPPAGTVKVRVIKQ